MYIKYNIQFQSDYLMISMESRYMMILLKSGNQQILGILVMYSTKEVSCSIMKRYCPFLLWRWLIPWLSQNLLLGTGYNLCQGLKYFTFLQRRLRAVPHFWHVSLLTLWLENGFRWTEERHFIIEHFQQPWAFSSIGSY